MQVMPSKFIFLKFIQEIILVNYWDFPKIVDALKNSNEIQILFLSGICNSKSIWNFNFCPKEKLFLFIYSTTPEILVIFRDQEGQFYHFTKCT
jgi:hypothetical protein